MTDEIAISNCTILQSALKSPAKHRSA